MKPSEARNATEYLRIWNAKLACKTCAPLRQELKGFGTDPFNPEAAMIRKVVTNHNCPGTE